MRPIAFVAGLVLGCGGRVGVVGEDAATDQSVETSELDIGSDAFAVDTLIEPPTDTAVTTTPPADALLDASTCSLRPVFDCRPGDGESAAAAWERSLRLIVNDCHAAHWACGRLSVWFTAGCATAVALEDDWSFPAFRRCLADRLALERWTCGDGETVLLIDSCTVK